MHLVGLGQGELLIHSPTWIDENTLHHIEHLGTPRVLFAPNHYHHLHLARYRERFPGAVVTASRQAMLRLARKDHLGICPVNDLALPPGMKWIEPEGLRTGEVWISLRNAQGATWIVCDAFFNHVGPLRIGVESMFLRCTRAVPGLCLGDSFKVLAIADKARYRRCLDRLLEEERPTRIIFSHGDALEVETLDRLRCCVHERL